MQDRITHEDLMRLIDGEVSPDERQRIESLVAGSSELSRELSIFRALGDELRELSFTPPDRGSSTWHGVQRRITRPFAWILLVGGFLAWAGYGVYVYFTTPGLLFTKLATAAIAIGVLTLLAEVVRERVREYATDPYRDVYR